MGVAEKIIGPRSKYDKSLPYTYHAKVYPLAGDKEICNHYYSDTICGLVLFLDKNKISPDEVELYGVYLEDEVQLDKKYCLDEKGRWLRIPKLCRSLETHYKETLDKKYKGHVEKGECEFEDRDQSVT